MCGQNGFSSTLVSPTIALEMGDLEPGLSVYFALDDRTSISLAVANSFRDLSALFRAATVSK